MMKPPEQLTRIKSVPRPSASLGPSEAATMDDISRCGARDCYMDILAGDVYSHFELSSLGGEGPRGLS